MKSALRLITLYVVLLLAACATPVDLAVAPEAVSGFHLEPSTATAVRHMAAAANPLAAQAGREILRAGGAAIDAAIAMQMVLNLVEPQSSGIGGGAFLMYWDGKRVQAFDGRETAPMAADENLFMSNGKPMAFYDAVVGGRSVGTPGVLRMLESVHEQHGRLPWARLFEPAIRLAEGGFAVSPLLNRQLASEKYLGGNPAARAYFYNADGTPKRVGTILRNPEFAQTLRTIALQGADAFYKGPIAAAIVRAVHAQPNAGRLAESDLATYRARERTPLCTPYKRWIVCGMPPPSSGGIAVAQMLGIFGSRNISVVPPLVVDGELRPQVDAVHLFTEAERLAFADRNLYVADPDFVPVDMFALTNRDYLRDRAKLIGARSMGVAKPGIPAGYRVSWAADNPSPRGGTSHIAVVDDNGNALSMTTTIENQFGARIMVHGFLLNNELTDFSFAPSAGGRPIANRVQPGKRPMSSMAPTLVFDRATNRLVATVGSMGGPFIIGHVVKTLVGIMDWQLDIQQAISLPNFDSLNGPTDLETGRFSRSAIEQLEQRGHEVREFSMPSGTQGIVRVQLPD
ncbi:MAG: gamma-glutamyltransferase, partial [Gemmatimonadota bacterium]